MIRCSNCDRIIVDQTEDGWKMRARMTVFRPEGAFAICPTCKSEVPVPIVMNHSGKSLRKPKLIVRT